MNTYYVRAGLCVLAIVAGLAVTWIAIAPFVVTAIKLLVGAGLFLLGTYNWPVKIKPYKGSVR